MPRRAAPASTNDACRACQRFASPRAHARQRPRAPKVLRLPAQTTRASRLPAFREPPRARARQRPRAPKCRACRFASPRARARQRPRAPKCRAACQRLARVMWCTGGASVCVRDAARAMWRMMWRRVMWCGRGGMCDVM